ncbi:hypothetical protein BDB00DRAFT_447296 [Zychaea mexicana]|uniref:uncharacterized protein n=1 Tax=Zychaea mexicana TaxID=64656 RepID=UPI0022FE7E14|nr:uncharacterized protein BDB00DRAFT_447296 [Zychaea mexicana]KAI9498401.1 hypothetical protein BDB00DRAFT_447296 [Zychaea mexicana]
MDEFETVHVVHDFTAENEDEISLKKGDPVLVIEKDEEFQDGWWRGRNVHGEIGLFPTNYVSKKPLALSSLEHKIGTLENTLSAMQLGDNIKNNGQQLSDAMATNTTHSSNTIAPPPTTTTTTPSSAKSQRSSTNSNNSNATTATSTTTNTTSRVGSVLKLNLQRTIAASLSTPALHDTSPEEWTIEQVASWLDTVGFKDMIDPFKDQEITGDVLLELTQQSLKELGIVTFGKRYKIHSAIQALKQEVARRDPLQQEEQQKQSMAPLSSDTDTNHQQAEKPYTQHNQYHHYRNGSFDDNSSVYNGGGGSVIASPGVSRNLPMVYPGSSGLPSSVWSSQDSEPERRGSSNMSSSATIGDLHSCMNPFNRAPSVSAPLNNNRPRVSTSIPRSSTEYAFRQPTSPSSSYGSYAQFSSFSSIVKEGPSIDQMRSIRSTQQQNNRPSFLRGSFLGGNSGSGGNSASSIFSLGGGGGGSGRKSVDLIAKRNTLAGEDGKPDMEGWLHKQGDRYKTWNKRWFVLRGPNLFYFKSSKDLRVKGIINLVGYSIIPDETIHSGKYCFKMQHEKERTFYFYTSSKESLKSWMRALMKVTISRNYTEPVLSSSSIATVSLEMARRMRPRPPSTIMEINEDGRSQQPRRSISESQAFSPSVMEAGGTQSSPLPPPPVMRQSRSENIMSSSSSSSSPPSLRRPPMQPVNHYNHPFTAEEPVVLSRNTSDSIDTFGRSMQREASNNHAHLSTVYDVPDEDDEDLIDPQQDHITKLESSDDLHRHKENEFYIRWVNDNMSSNNSDGHHHEPIQSLAQMKSGEPLIGLLEGLSGKTVRRQDNDKSNTPSMIALDTIVAAFRFMGRVGITVDGSFTIKDVFGGDETKVMVMLEAIKDWADGQSTYAQRQ